MGTPEDVACEKYFTPPLTEKQFESQIKDLAKTLNWAYYHTWRSIHSPAGYPDCCLVKTLEDNETVLIMAELKSEKGKLSLAQIDWLYILNKVNSIFVAVWRPSDFDVIVSILQARGLADIIKVWKSNVQFVIGCSE